ncbi:sterol desaturase family protein [Alteromonas sp. 5E99-2]|uniref:sterol desaturase family protein n=1 Tax=Alteromonas sp. 5E99-2 TaxID=2817683 RepID=UPI001A990FC7|nr:sterol desaturase family protein [Alteromonas sp. 5E99-2]MBO1254395.1 sterol desaturase family protein [Alteromonas sp. 5E99-2]
MTFLETHELWLRLASFVGVLAFMAILEYIRPKKTRVMPRFVRWSTNLLLVVINSLALRLVTPILAVGAAAWAQSHNLGVLNWIPLPPIISLVLAVTLLDMAIYFQHVLSHRVPMLWRFHKIHHADRDIDVTTGLRFHPVEIVFSMFYKLAWVVLLGPSVSAVIFFEVLLNASAMFNHSNVSLTQKVDSWLRTCIVTPDFHRVHHSVIPRETHSNFGFFLSIWDRIFNTHIPQPLAKHKDMVIGLSEFQSHAPNTLIWCLTAPWKKKAAQKGKNDV